MSALSVAGSLPTGVLRINGTFPDLIVKDHGGYQSRHASTLAMIREVFETHPTDFTGQAFDFFVGSFDNPESCNDLAKVVKHVLAYSVTDQCLPNVTVIPDFIYGGWPETGITSYTDTVAAMTQAGQTPPVHDKLFWIGNADMHECRGKLIELGRQHHDHMDFVPMQWAQQDGSSATRLASSHYVSLPDHARYGLLLDIRGAGYSGRLKLLMHAGRPVFLVERPFREFFYPHLKPFEHYMPVKADLADLAQKVAEVKGNPELAHKLGQGALAFARQYLTRDYAMGYLRQVLRDIALKS